MDLETRFYELQDRYQTLINDYEQLKEAHEPQRSEEWINLTEDEQWKAIQSVDWSNDPISLLKLVELELKEKNEDSLRHRDQLGTRYDPFVRNSGH